VIQGQTQADASMMPQSGMTFNNPLAGPTQVGMQLVIGMLPNGKQNVVVLLHSASGTMKADLDPEEADNWASMLHSAATQARSGLIIPGNQLPDMTNEPNGQGVLI
jgi:hypothetical protein